MTILPLLIGIGLFWVIVLILNRRYELKKRGITLEGGALIWRTKRGLRFIDRTARAHKRSWLVFGTVAAVTGVVLMFFIAFSLCFNFYVILSRPEISIPGVRLVLPGGIPGGIPGLTVYWWLVAIASVLLVHEFSHGFLMRAQGIPTKSMGGLLFVAIPGGFVEPDEKKLRASPISKRLRVYGVGSFANILFALLCLGVILLMLSPKPGLYVGGIRENSPAENVGLGEGARLLKIDNVTIDSYQDFLNFMENTEPGQKILVSTDKGNFSVELAKHPENENLGYLGVFTVFSIPRSRFLSPITVAGVMFYELTGRRVFHPYVYDLPRGLEPHSAPLVPWELIDLLKWMFVLNLGIGLFNLLPMIPLDGGYIMQGLIERRSSKEKARKVSYVVSILMLAMLILNFVPYLW